MGIITYSNLSVYHHRKWKGIRTMVTYAVWIEKDTGEFDYVRDTEGTNSWTESKEAEKVRIEAKGKADANRILAASLTTNVLKDKGIEATIKLAESGNSKVIVIGSGEDGLPLILGNN